MNQQLAVIANGIINLPSNIAKTLENIKTSPSVSSESPFVEVKTQITPLPQLNQTMFPKVEHWGSAAYRTLRKKSKQKEEGGEGSESDKIPGGVYSCYMEDENGNPIPDTERDAARTRARTFWWKLHHRGLAPPKSGEIDADIAGEYVAFMEEGYPWLRYCNNHWKSMQIWRNHYSSWHTDRKKELAAKAAAEAAAAATEGDIIDIDANENDVQGIAKKRPQVEEGTGVSKRRRLGEDDLIRPQASRSVSNKRSKVCLRSLLRYKFANKIKQGILYDNHGYPSFQIIPLTFSL